MFRMDELMISGKGQKALKQIAEKHKASLSNENENVAWRVGCTAVVVLVTPEYIYCANSGDSRAVLGKVSQDG